MHGLSGGFNRKWMDGFVVALSRATAGAEHSPVLSLSVTHSLPTRLHTEFRRRDDHPRHLTGLIWLLALVAAGCGDADDSATTTAAGKADCGHVPFIERPDNFDKIFHARLGLC